MGTLELRRIIAFHEKITLEEKIISYESLPFVRTPKNFFANLQVKGEITSNLRLKINFYP